MEQQVTVQRRKLILMVSVGLMAALVFVGNYMQISIPVAIGSATRIHLGNSMCLLAGMLFGPMTGGLASGIGAGLFDLLNPLYITSAPYTFLSKFAMGFLAGVIARYAFPEGKRRISVLIASGVAGQLAYIALYLLKSYVELLFLGNDPRAALVAILPKAATSSLNAAAAIVISVPLALAIRTALLHTGFSALLAAPPRKKAAWTAAAVLLAVLICAAALALCLYLSIAIS